MILKFFEFFNESIYYRKDSKKGGGKVIYLQNDYIDDKDKTELKNTGRGRGRISEKEKEEMKKLGILTKKEQKEIEKRDLNSKLKERNIKIKTNFFNRLNNEDIKQYLVKYKDDINKAFAYNVMILKKTNVKVINFFNLDQEFSKVLKKGEFTFITQNKELDKLLNHVVTEFINKDRFLRKIYLYFVDIVNRNLPNVDMIVIPHSSSNFNKEFLKNIKHRFISTALYVDESFFKKNIYNIEIDEEWLKTADDIYRYDEKDLEKFKKTINYWKTVHEPKREIRRKVDEIVYEIEEIIKKRKETRGRKSNRLKELQNMQIELENLIKSMPSLPGKDPTIDKYGKTKEWQIKNIGERQRLAIKNFMDFNYGAQSELGNLKKRKNIISDLKGKKVVIFDDNISSGATLDDMCRKLIDSGVNKEDILCVTLGVMSHTEFERKGIIGKYNKKDE